MRAPSLQLNRLPMRCMSCSDVPRFLALPEDADGQSSLAGADLRRQPQPDRVLQASRKNSCGHPSVRRDTTARTPLSSRQRTGRCLTVAQSLSGKTRCLTTTRRSACREDSRPVWIHCFIRVENTLNPMWVPESTGSSSRGWETRYVPVRRQELKWFIPGLVWNTTARFPDLKRSCTLLILLLHRTPEMYIKSSARSRDNHLNSLMKLAFSSIFSSPT